VRLKQTAAPAAEPITADEAKDHVLTTETDQDDRITALIRAAREYVERISGWQLVTATWRQSFDAFPVSGSILYVPRPPLQSVSQITYYDTLGVQQTLDSALYQVDVEDEPGRIAEAPAASWPTTESNRLNAVQITFVAGYGAAAAVPEDWKQAIYLLVGHWFENREAVGQVGPEIQLAVESLLEPFRFHGVAQ